LIRQYWPNARQRLASAKRPRLSALRSAQPSGPKPKARGSRKGGGNCQPANGGRTQGGARCALCRAQGTQVIALEQAEKPHRPDPISIDGYDLIATAQVPDGVQLRLVQQGNEFAILLDRNRVDEHLGILV
jgi:hypothetical protein